LTEAKKPEERDIDGDAERRARKMLHGGEGHDETAEDPRTARRAAEQILEESDERTFDPAAHDHEDDSVIRRSSDETARNPD
jgi:hypothetical protein